MLITLQQIRDKSPCRPGWTALLTSLGNPTDMTVPVSIGDIALSNGAADALWCLRCAEFDRRDVVRCILPAVKRASVHTTDQRVADCTAAIDAWLARDDSIDLKAAARAARAAAYAAYAAYAYTADTAAYAAAACAAYVAYVAYVAYAAADAAAYAAYAAYAARGAARAAARAADAAADAAERKQQIADICAVFPPVILAGDT